MIDLEKLKPILDGYKRHFSQHWDEEKYKWEAIKHFQIIGILRLRILARCLKSQQIKLPIF